MTIPVLRPSCTDAEIDAVTRVLRSGWWGQGAETAALETEFAAFVGARHAVAVSSCTAALHLALTVAGVGKGDEVIVPSLTFVSTAAAVLYCGATPVFADVDADTLNLDANDAARKLTPRTRALLPVHYGGNPVELAAFGAMAETHALTLIEDAAHAAGARYYGRPIGSTADLAVYSFHPVKNLASPEGGMVVTSSSAHAERLRRLRWMGISRDTYARTDAAGYAWAYDIPELGWKYNPNDVSAAIARVQLARLPDTNRRRTQLAARYTGALSDLPALELPRWNAPDTGTESAWHLYIVRCDERDALSDFLKARGISTGVHYRPVHLFEAFAPYRTALPVTEREWTRLLSLPMFPDMTDAEQDTVMEAVHDFYR